MLDTSDTTKRSPSRKYPRAESTARRQIDECPGVGDVELRRKACPLYLWTGFTGGLPRRVRAFERLMVASVIAYR